MLPAKKPGSFSLLVENDSQTKTFNGEVVEANTSAGTCLVKFSGGKTQVCECRPGAPLKPGDKVLAKRIPGRARLVVQVSGTTTFTVTNTTYIRSSVGAGDKEILPIPPLTQE